MAFDVRTLWDFDDPAASELRFQTAFEDPSFSEDEKLEIWAQLARTFSLRAQCEKCHRLLDEYWDEAMNAGGRPRASFELERGRAFRSNREPELPKPFFEAVSLCDVEDLKIDALHMVAIMVPSVESKRIKLKAHALAEASSDPLANRWQGTLCNNLGWSCFDDEEFEAAKKWFEQALREREKYGNKSAIQIAKWCLGRCLRAVGELEKALAIQLELIAGGATGYAQEEVGEILLLQGKLEEARPYFRSAAEHLTNDLGPDSERIKRMLSLG